MNFKHSSSRARLAPPVAHLASLLLVPVLAVPSCSAKPGAPTPPQQPKQQPAVAAPQPVAAVKTPFDGQRAFEHVRRQVAFGPRPSGSQQLAATRKYIKDELSSYGLAVREQAFMADTPAGGIPMVNVIGELTGASPGVVIVASHYDTKRTPPGFLGANDAGSSTGALLEIARVMAEQAKTEKPRFTVQFVFFDGEEAVEHWTEEDSVYGSRHYVELLERAGQVATIKAMVLLDMIGDRDLVIQREGSSSQGLNDIIWQTAAALGYGKHFPNATHYIDDDHRPFLEAGIAAVDLIDFTYGTDAKKYGPGGPQNAYWHTNEDTLDKISAESLKVVGDVVIAALPRIMTAIR